MYSRLLKSVLILTATLVALFMASAGSHAQAPLTAIPGSPFSFSGNNANVTLLSNDERFLFVTNQWSGEVSVLNVGEDGSLSMKANYPAISYTYGFLYLCGMALNPAGTRLYVVGANFGGTSAVSVLDVASDGTLTLLQESPLPYGSTALNSIAYISQTSGDMVCVNGNAYLNAVYTFPVAGDGTLGASTEYATGGHGGGYFYATPTTKTLSHAGKFLFVTNGGAYAGGSLDISVFAIHPDGSLALVPGSPFAIPNASCSGAIAVDPAGAYLYAGTDTGRIARFAIASDGSLSTSGATATGIVNGPINGFAISPDGTALVATVIGYDQLFAVDTASLRLLLGAPVANDGGSPAGIHFNGAGTRVYVGNAVGGTVTVGAYNFTPTVATPPLTLDLIVNSSGSLDKFGRAAVSGTLTSSLPADYTIYLTIRQRQGHNIVELQGYVSVATTGLNGMANWTWTAASNTRAFKGGQAEIVASTVGFDPITSEYMPVSVTQVINLKGK